MFEQVRWPREGFVPVVAGLFWLACARDGAPAGLLLGLLPGCLLIGCGLGTLLFAGDLRIPQFAAGGSVLGVLLSPLMAVVVGPTVGAALFLVSLASFVAAGAISLRQEPHTPGLPVPRLSLGLAAQVAVDDALLSVEAFRMRVPDGEVIERARREVDEARDLFAERGWLGDPRLYHRAPPCLSDPDLRPGAFGSLRFEHLTFDSGYAPDPDEPGYERWLGYDSNRRGHAWVLRHREDRPWLVCVHGFRMGTARTDMAAFRAAFLHQRLGLNVLLPVLPLHGPRRLRVLNGDRFLSGEFLDTVHAVAHTVWDLRRLIGWVRAQTSEPIGVAGVSLGAYHAALLASLEPGLAGVIVGIPAVRFEDLMWRHGPAMPMRFVEQSGLRRDVVSEVLRPVSPLALRPLVPRSRRFLFASLADRLVTPGQARDLWRHWEEPRIEWYAGGHLTFYFHTNVHQLVLEALRDSGLVQEDRLLGMATRVPARA